MKLVINDFEVEIKARRTWRSKRANSKDTMSFLNQVSIFCGDASKQYDFEGYEALSKNARVWSHEIYTYLNDNGLYDNQ